METIDFEFVVQRDRELAEAGLQLFQRPFHVATSWMKARGISGPIFDEEIRGPLMAHYRALYPDGDFAGPPLFEGGVVLRGQMYGVNVDVGFGDFSIDPAECINISREELGIIYRHEPGQFWNACYAAADVIDIAYGMSDFRHIDKDAYICLNNARSAVAANTRILKGLGDLDSVVQTSCLAAELAMKGALVHFGWTEKRLRRLGHNLEAVANALIEHCPTNSDDELRKACSAFPDYVETRYAAHGLSRSELMSLAIRSQFVVADVVRRLTKRNLGAQVEADPETPPRTAY